MGGAHADVSKHVKAYIGVFVALAVFTGLTVGASYIHFGTHTMNIVVAMLIALVKASMVAAIFMHLKWERGRSIWVTLAFCGVFFLVLLLLPILTTSDLPKATKLGTWDLEHKATAVSSQH